MSWKRWIQYFTSVRTEINFILGACLTTVIAIDFILSNVPELSLTWDMIRKLNQ